MTRNTSSKLAIDGDFGQKVGGNSKIFPSVEIAVTTVHQNGKMQMSAIRHNSMYCPQTLLNF
jgi:hypothetical protein